MKRFSLRDFLQWIIFLLLTFFLHTLKAFHLRKRAKACIYNIIVIKFMSNMYLTNIFQIYFIGDLAAVSSNVSNTINDDRVITGFGLSEWIMKLYEDRKKRSKVT